MVCTLVIWVVMAFLSYLYGMAAKRALSALFSSGDNADVPSEVLLLLGLCVLGTVSAFLSLFMPIGFWAFFGVLLAGILYLVLDFRHVAGDFKKRLAGLRGSDAFTLAAAGIIAAMVLAETSLFVPKNYDTALYHAQAIRWIEEFPALPGLGNLHFRFAYNSSWLVLNALFSFSFLKIQSFHALNGFLMAVSMVYFFRMLRSFAADKKFLFVFTLFLIPAAYYIQVNFVSSPGTDTPAAFMTWVFLLYYMSKVVEKEGPNPLDSAIILFTGAFLVTVKLSCLPVLILPAYLYLKDLFRGKTGRAFLAAVLSLFVIAPWLARNVILSGYLVYPFAALDLFRVDWKMPAAVLENDKLNIRIWANAYRGGNFLSYLANWFLTLKPQYKLIIYPAMLGWLGGVVYFIVSLLKNRGRERAFIGERKRWIVPFLLAYGGVVYLFSTAPDVRYGSVFFIVFGLMHAAFPLSALVRFRDGGRTAVRICCIILVAGLAVFEGLLADRYFFKPREFSMFNRENVSVLKDRLLVPADYPKNTTGYVRHDLDGKFFFYTPEITDHCWYDPFPSVPINGEQLFLLRNGETKGGFRPR